MAGNRKPVSKEIGVDKSKDNLQNFFSRWTYITDETVTPPTVAFNFSVIWLKFIVLNSYCVGVIGTDKELTQMRCGLLNQNSIPLVS